MKTFREILAFAFQVFIGILLGFLLVLVIPVAEGIVALAVGAIVGVWGLGALTGRLGKTMTNRQYISTLIGTVVGTGLGVAAMFLTQPTAPLRAFFPLIGALLGFYVPRLTKL